MGGSGKLPCGRAMSNMRAQLRDVFLPVRGSCTVGFFGSKKEAELGVRKTIKVLPRETLKSISEREYGDEGKWEVIFDKNKWRFDGGDPSAVYPGMDLDIPEIAES